MSPTATLLFELGTEELPAGALQPMAAALEEQLCAGLTAAGLGFTGSQRFATPRRLAVLVEGLTARAPDSVREVLGPPVASARDGEGNWTPAALGFARKQGMEPESLASIDTDKGARLGIRETVPGATAAEVIPGLVRDAVAAIPVAKRMRWGRSRDEFLRPVQWLVLMLDAEVLPLSLFGLNSGRESRGHRFHHPQPILFDTADEYEKTLLEAKVIADFGKRRERIRAQVLDAAGDANVGFEGGLLDEVTGLVEWPVALRGSFDPGFLDVPAPALISSMREHQKYFHLTDADGALLPGFITVANIESRDPGAIIAGNERVIRPRLADAKFFFEGDKATRLATRLDRLDGVVFQQQLGSVADKVRRIAGLCRHLAPLLGADAALTDRAATLAKCDLVTDLVLEFPELQGIAGGHYARHDGEPAAVADAIEQHYWPRFAGDTLPASPEAAAVALADRLDTLVGIFGIGQHPTGSKDPFGLRRAALAVLRILIDRGVQASVDDLVAWAAAGYDDATLAAGARADATTYIIDRLAGLYEDRGISGDVLRAVIASGNTVPAIIDARVMALKDLAGSDVMIALAAANKRVANILAKADLDSPGQPDPVLLQQPEEQALFDALRACAAATKAGLDAGDYPKVFAHLAGLRDSVDAFFDAVMVNAEDVRLRNNRLNLLAALRAQFLQVADIAELARAA